MALTGTFEADFSSFYTAVQQATVELRSFEQGANKVEDSLERMANKFSGQKVIQDAQLMTAAIERLGGTSTLTEAELAKVGRVANEAVEKMRALGMDVPKGMQDIADATKGAGDSTESLMGTVVKLAASYLTVEAALHGVEAAFDLFVGVLESSITAAAAAEETDSALAAALRAQGVAIPSVTDAYNQYAEALQRTTTYSAGAVKAAEAVLAQVGGVMPRDMEKALQATTNLAAGLRIDLASAAMMVAKAAEGQTTALQKAGVVITTTSGQATSFGAALDQINTKFAGAAQAAGGTFQGELTKLGNAWENLEESIGRVVTQNETVRTVLADLNTLLSSSTGELTQNADANNLVSDAVILAAEGTRLFVQGLELLTPSLTDAVNFLNGLREAELKLQVTTAETYKTWAEFRVALGLMDAQKAADEILNMQAALVVYRGELAKVQAEIRGNETAGRNAAAGLAAFDERLGGMVGHLQATRGQTEGVTTATDQAGDAWAKSTVNLKALNDAQTENEARTKAQLGAVAQLQSVSEDYQKTVAALPPQLVAVVQGYLAAGVAADTLAKASGLTASQISALTLDLKDQVQALKLADAVEAEHAKLVASYVKIEGSLRHDAVQAQIDDVIAWSEAYKAEMEKRHTWTVQTEADILRVVSATIDAIIQKTEELDPTTRAHAKKVADEAAAAYQFALAHLDQYTAESLIKMQDAADQAQLTLAEWGGAAAESVAAVGAAADGTAGAFQKVAGAMQASASAARALTTTATGVLDAGRAVYTPGAGILPGQRVPGDMDWVAYNKLAMPNYDVPANNVTWVTGARAAGGPVAGGQSYLVGEKGPELFVPPSSGGTILPHGGGAPSVVIQSGAFSFVYPIMDNPQAMDQLARTVGDAIVSKLTRSGARV